MYPKQTSFLIIGTKKSGYSSAKLLLEKGAIVYFYDDSPSQSALKNQEELISLGAKKLDDISKGVDVADVLVLSPAVPIDSEVAIKFKEYGKRIIGELELGSYFITAPIIAVTGTNGKTSVCSIVSHVLTESKIKNVLVEQFGLENKINILDLKNHENAQIRKFAEFVYKNIFYTFTQKRWGLKIEDLDQSVTSRVPVYISYEDRYFTDKYQFMPKTALLQ